MLAPSPRAALGFAVALLAACTPATPAAVSPARRAVVVPVEPTPRYAMPTCPLRYEMKTVETSHMDGMPAEMDAKMGTAVLTVATIDARPNGGRLELLGGVSMEPRRGRHRGYMPPDTSYAPVHLETDGMRWVERDGPTQLYDALGTQGGVQWFFPDLPASGAVGSSSDWEIPRASANDVLRTEATRGARPWLAEQLARADAAAAAAPPMAPAKPIPPTRLKVVVERWTEEKGVKVVELAATGTEHVSDATASAVVQLAVTATFTYRATYRITATGRLLHATIEKDGVIDMRDADPRASQHHTQHTSRSMNLVAACDGPTEPTLMEPLSLEERAIKAWSELWLAFMGGEHDKVVGALDPALRTKHGDARLWDAFTSFKALRGDKALAPAVMVADEDVSTDGATVRLVVHGLTEDPQRHVMMPLDVIVTLRDGGDRWLVQSLRADLTLDEKRNLLELSRDRVVVRKGWPPK